MPSKTALFATGTVRNISLQGTCNNRHVRFSTVKTCSPLEVRTINARAKVETAKGRLGSWRAVGTWLGSASKATACNRLVKHPDFRPSVKLVEAIEAATLPPAMGTVEVCPDCGSIHTGRCHGKPVARVVIVSGKARNRKRYHRPCLDDAEYARFIEWRQTCTNS